MQEKKLITHKLLKNNLSCQESLPEIPDKRYFTISEASALCGVKPHVLRYWEQEFLQIKPSKRRGNRRYYQNKDVLIVRQIRELLYKDGFTIDGARAQLKNACISKMPAAKNNLQIIIAELETVLQNLQSSSEDI